MNAIPSVFGYGSLVNRATHACAPARQATITGWRRAWVHTAHRTGPFLTAVPSPGDRIEGLIAAIPGGDWAALDLREAGYDRLPTPEAGVMIYAVPAQALRPQPAPFAPPDGSRTPEPGPNHLRDPAQASGQDPILLSYVDVVFQGYLREYGPAGLERFVATTDGWHVPILNDRAAPRYPRHQRLTPDELARTDAVLRDLRVTLIA